MFRLEKVFQNDDDFFIKTSIKLKTIIIFLLIYFFSILEQNTVYDLKNFQIFLDSDYLKFSIIFSLCFFIFSNFFFKSHSNFTRYNLNIIKKDLINFFASLIITIPIIIYYQKNFFKFNSLYLIMTLLIFLIFFQKLSKFIYNYLVQKNIIQKNILIIGTFQSVKKILDEKKNDIYVYKCCMILDKNNEEIKKLRLSFKIPIFKIDEDIRSLLEYHSLGQIWILDDKNINVNSTLDIVLKYSVDILIINFFDKEKKNNLINSKYSYQNYEISKFHGTNFLLKIFLDKILSLLFLLILSPILLIICLLIYLEDGAPILFTQDRTGWDGRRFKIYKFRSLKKSNFLKTNQVIIGDQRLLKIGKIIRKYSLDEVPQFFNVLTGEMSIVGPRPHMVEHDIYYSNIFKNFLKRHKANPGITGWAQINGFRGPTLNQELMKKRMEFDLWYLNNWSLFLDFKIIFKTFFAIFKYKGT